ncbi:MAG TPA: Ig-like domain-containing protein [Candidatus Nanoarchaeia archaeon]|nr:Ig-like domain-containing protein [Candidatus Nanoarchaeia archaeon]
MYFGKKGEVGVLLAIGLVLAAGAALFFTATDSVGITGAVVSESSLDVDDQLQTNSSTNDTEISVDLLAPSTDEEGLTTAVLKPQGDISSCQELTNGEYRLTESVSATNTCFTIKANDITLDCQGFTINYGSTCGSTDGGCAGINATNRNGIHIRNCGFRFVKGAQDDAYAIYFKNVSNSSIEGANISAAGGWGIILEKSGNNNISWVNITTGTGSAQVGVSAFLMNGTNPNAVNNVFYNIQTRWRVAEDNRVTFLHKGGAVNTIIFNTSFGYINWTNTNLTHGINISINATSPTVFITQNTVGLTDQTNNIYNKLNGSARIELRQLNYRVQPDLLKNGVRCDNQTGDLAFKCNISYYASSSTLFANVTSFSNYTTEENDPPNVTNLNPANNINLSTKFSTTKMFNATITDDHSSLSSIFFQFTNKTNPFNLTAQQLVGDVYYVTIDLALLDDGTHGVRVFANDSLNNVNNSEFINFTIDRTPPNISIFRYNSTSNFTANFSNRGGLQINVSINDSTTYGKSVILGLTHSRNTTGFNVTLNQVDYWWTVNLSMSTLSDGLYRIQVYANDTVDNVNNSVANLSFIVDTTPPNVSVVFLNQNSSYASNFTKTGMIMINATFNDTLTTVTTVAFGLTNSKNATQFNTTPVKVGSFWIVNLSLATLSDGEYNITFYADDTLGNRNFTVGNLSFRVDTTPPNVSLFITNTTPINNSNFTNSGVIQINATLNDTLTTVTHVRFGIFNPRNNSEFNLTTIKLGSFWTQNLSLATLTDAVYTIRVYGNDTLGNINNSVKNLSFTVDTVPPNISIFRYNSTSNFTANFSNRGGLQINVSINDTTTYGKSVILGLTNSKNSTGFNVTLNQVDYWWTVNLSMSTLSDGVYRIQVYANDTVGNVNNSVANLSFIIDSTPPNVSTFFTNDSATNNSNHTNSGVIQINVTLNDTLTTVTDVQFGIFNTANNSEFNLTTIKLGSFWTQNLSLATLTDAVYFIRVYGNDTLGNMNNSVTNLSFTVDTTPPTVSITEPENNAILDGIQVFNATVRDATTVVNTVIFQFNDGVTIFNLTASNTSGFWNVSVDTTTLTEDSQTIITVFANDTLGNLNNTKSITVTIDNIPVPIPGGAGPADSSPESTPSPAPESEPEAAPAPSPPQDVSVGETASAEEVAAAIMEGLVTTSITSISEEQVAGLPLTLQKEYLLTIKNTLVDQKLVLSGLLEEPDLTMENEEQVLTKIKTLLSQQGITDEVAAQEELEIQKLLENVEVLQVYKTKVSYLFPTSLTGAAIASPLQITGKHISGTLLKDAIINAPELEVIEVGPGQTVNRVIKIRQGLRLDRKNPPRIVFSAGGQEVLVKDLLSQQEIVTGTAVDVDPVTKKLDFYVIVAPQLGAGTKRFTVEMNINIKKASQLNQALPLKVKLPFFFAQNSRSIFSELYGPYDVDLQRGALLAVQYDASKIKGDYEVVGKVYDKNNELVAENIFEIEQE